MQPNQPPHNEGDALADRLQVLYTGVVFDVLRDLGHDNPVLPPGLWPVGPTEPLAGRIHTVSGSRKDLDPHESLLRWTELLANLPADHVIVCQPHDGHIALMGELSAETLQLRGVRGYVVDGGCRDVSFIRALGFPVWARFHTPADIRGRWSADEVGQPIKVGDVTVVTGDYLLADADGVVVVPAAVAADAVAEAEVAVRSEDRVREAIRAGADPASAYRQHGKF